MTSAVRSKAVVQRMVMADAARMFEGGMNQRLTQSWDSTSYTADQVIYSQLPTLRARARHQLRNNDYVARLDSMLKSNVVGSNGFNARSQIRDAKGEPDLAARSAVQQGWREFSDQVGLIELCDLVVTGLITDGEALVFLRQTKKGELRPELIDPVRLDVEYNRSDSGKNLILMGIEYDAHLTPVAYHINDSYEGNHPGQGEQGHPQMKRTRITADRMIHVFKKQFVGQKRGVPLIAVSLNRLFQMGRYEEAALTAARIGAAKMGFFSSSEDDEYKGDNGDNMTINAEAGTFENIGDLQFQAFDPTYPAGEFTSFMNRALQGLAGGFGVDYPVLGNDMANVNYSSARIGMMETRELYKTIQNFLIRNLIRPIYKSWLALSLFAARLTIKNRPLNRGLDYYLPMEFVGRRWDWVDPQKDANGQKTLVDLRVKSVSQIIREQGGDPLEVFSEIAEEQAMMRELGISTQQVFQKLEGQHASKSNTAD